jgi:predicted glycosyltransferase/nucleoside-diphosphate-sugar epimerase
MRCLVTGTAGFVGSHLAERLLDAGHEVIGVDCLVPYYSTDLKRRNMAPLLERDGFTFIEGDLVDIELGPVVEGIDLVFHQAAQAGVRASWGAGFSPYIRHNVTATQRLLEAFTDRPLRAFIYASSSSVYGNSSLPMCEDACPQPLSPYGMSKLAGEHLCTLYHQNFGIPTVALRYFTVYGPRQRPDMAINRFIAALLRDELITVYGGGGQSRDFTYVADIVTANLRAAECIDTVAGSIFNVGGGSRITVNALLSLLGELVGRTPRLQYEPAQRGDVEHTGADCSRVARALEFVPSYALRDGLAQQVAWQRGLEEQRESGIHLVAQPLTHSNNVETGAAADRAGPCPACGLAPQVCTAIGASPTIGASPMATAAPVRAVRGTGCAPRILLYSHDTFGLGHLRRNLAIAGRVSCALPGVSLLLLSGSQAVQQFVLPLGADIIKLPSVTKLGHEQYVAQGLSVTPAEVLALRRGLILETVMSFKPDLLLVDHAPLGMRGELRPALEYVRANLPESRVVLGLRDILDEPTVVCRTWREQAVYAALETFYDRLLIYGVPEVCDPIGAYELPASVAARTSFCGYIRRDDPIAPAEEVRREIGLGADDPLVLVTAGGGGDGMPLLEAYVQALCLGPVGWTSLMVTGPFMPDAERGRLEERCCGLPSVIIRPFERDVPSLMHAADAVVTMGGYNSLCEVTGSGTRALVIPRTSPRTEQLLRGQAFARLGLVDLLLLEHATPADLREAVRDAIAHKRDWRGECQAWQPCMAGGSVLQNGLDRLVPMLVDLMPSVAVQAMGGEGAFSHG